ncbi:hypothetical protein AtNW77_Chr3g0195041 [Arabidopsis thaliana]
MSIAGDRQRNRSNTTAEYVPPSEYAKKIKLSTRCYIHEVLTTFDKLQLAMSKSERAWFENHPSFQYIFARRALKGRKKRGSSSMAFQSDMVYRNTH